MWTLLTGFLVMFMQAGFALAETGFTRAKNVAHTMMMNFMVYAIGMTGYWIMGFALQMGGASPLATLGGTGVLDGEFTISLFGKDFGLWGTKGFFLAGSTYDVGVFALFLFQMVFMDTAATIPTGAMAERWKFSSFVIYGFFISMITYPLFANWVWGGGWLSQLGKNFGLGHGYVDFAGSSVVHMVGGVTALAGAMMLGPRIGKFNKDGTPNPIPGHNLPMAALGCFILAFGWFGFNPGSTLAGGGPRISVIAVNTMLASAAGADFPTVFHGGEYGQIIGPIVNFCFIFGASWAFFKIYDVVFGMRVSPEVEMEGLDVPEMGAHGYPEVHGPATLVHAMGTSAVKPPAMSMAPGRSR